MIEVPISLVCAECGAKLHGEVNPLAYNTVVKVTPCRCVVPCCGGCGEPLGEEARCATCFTIGPKDWLG